MDVDKIEVTLAETNGRPLKKKWEIPELLNIDGNYTVIIKGQVFTKQEKTNNDGTVNVVFKICPNDFELLPEELEKKIKKQ
jgi:hypothetical protein